MCHLSQNLQVLNKKKGPESRYPMLAEYEEDCRISESMSEMFILIIPDVVDADLQMYDDTGSARSL